MGKQQNRSQSAKRFAGAGLFLALAVAMGVSFGTSEAQAFELPRWTPANSLIQLAADQAAGASLAVADFRAEALEQDLEFRPLEAIEFEDAQGDSNNRDLFGEVPIPVSHLAVERRWRSIAPFRPSALFGARCEGDSALCDSPLMHAWARLRSALSGAPRFEKIRRVNAEVNAAIRYRTNTENYGVPDYWASPEEMARRGSGDCKETALAKMWMLAALDVPLSTMRIVVLKDVRRDLGHAVLVVSLADRNLVLDNVTGEIRRDNAIGWYQPLYAVSTAGSWIYGVRRPKLMANSANPANS